jgi:GR25 family glycosyltransferase involved in LPS biosynthesis
LNGNRERITHFEAVDGRTLNRASLLADGIIKEDLQSFSVGAMGNALSHRALLQKCVALDENFTVFEDDAILNHRFFRSCQKA